MGHRPFLKRYLKRDEILSSITACDAVLNEALGMFGVSVFLHSICEARRLGSNSLLGSSPSRSALSS